jgi:hypothetical protein
VTPKGSGGLPARDRRRELPPAPELGEVGGRLRGELTVALGEAGGGAAGPLSLHEREPDAGHPQP